MMCRSGVSPAVKRSKLARLMPRRAASDHRPATQLSKSAAAARIASAVIDGSPDAPGCPLPAPTPPAGAGPDPVADGWNKRPSQLSGLSCACALAARTIATRYIAAKYLAAKRVIVVG